MTQSALPAREFASNVRALLKTESIGRSVRAYDTVSSTNTLAAEWAADDAPHGALVLAEFQTEGRGRLGRAWQAHAGLNLTFSVLLRPQLPPDRLGMITIAASLAVADAVDARATPLRTSIKWPNDVLLNGKKCCGMLLETARAPEGVAVVVGIGLNVNQDAFPDELSERATSILLETGQMTDRAHLLAEICRRLEHRMVQAGENPRMLRRLYMARMPDLGEPVRLRFSDRDGGIYGVPLGLDEFGGLIVETDSGRRVFHAGEVTRSPL